MVIKEWYQGMEGFRLLFETFPMVLDPTLAPTTPFFYFYNNFSKILIKV
jgi:hypothetical protein